MTSVAFGLLPPAFELWHANHPSTRIALREFTHRQALDDAVRAGVGDIAVGPRPPHWKGPLVALGWEEFVVVLPRSDPLTESKRAISLEELARPRLVFSNRPDHGLTHLIENRLRARRLRSPGRCANRTSGGCRASRPAAWE